MKPLEPLSPLEHRLQFSLRDPWKVLKAAVSPSLPGMPVGSLVATEEMAQVIPTRSFNEQRVCMASLCAGFALTVLACESSPANHQAAPPSQPAVEAKLQTAASAQCPTFLPGRSQGRTSSKILSEVSGVVASRNNDDVLWVHNDSGDRARLYAIKTDATLLEIFDLPTVRAIDWEDIAIGPGKNSKEPHLYVADIGDNARNRSSGVLVHRVPEPKIDGESKAPKGQLGSVETFRLHYPDQPHDAETLLVDPTSGEVVLLTKALLKPPRVFFAPQLEGSNVTLRGGESLDLEAAEIPAFIPTGGDVSPDGRWVLVRSYGAAYLWQRDPAKPLHEAFSSPACEVPLQKEPQGEAIAFAADGRGYFTLSEGSHQPLFFYALKDTKER